MKATTYGELISLLNSGKTVKQLAAEKLSPYGERKTGALLREANYSYDNTAKLWQYTGDNEAPDNEPLPTTTAKRKQVTPASPSLHGDFTPEQIAALIELANERLSHEGDFTNASHSLHTRIAGLHRQAKKRKTVEISQTVSDQFDAFAAHTKFNKSDILELALLDFMERYK